MMDRFTIRMIVAFMGIEALIALGGGMWLAAHEKSLPDALIALGGVALGNLGTFLVSARSSVDTQAVNVVKPNDPMPVDPGV